MLEMMETLIEEKYWNKTDKQHKWNTNNEEDIENIAKGTTDPGVDCFNQ